jgi:hypothetical protein
LTSAYPGSEAFNGRGLVQLICWRRWSSRWTSVECWKGLPAATLDAPVTRRHRWMGFAQKPRCACRRQAGAASRRLADTETSTRVQTKRGGRTMIGQGRDDRSKPRHIQRRIRCAAGAHCGPRQGSSLCRPRRDTAIYQTMYHRVSRWDGAKFSSCHDSRAAIARWRRRSAPN